MELWVLLSQASWFLFNTSKPDINYDTCDPKLEVRKPEKIHWKIVMVIAQELLKTVALKLHILHCYYHSLVCMFDFIMVGFRLFKHWTAGWKIWNSTFSRFPLSFFCLQFEYSMGYSFVVSNSAAAQYFYWNATSLELIQSTNSQDKESENLNIDRNHEIYW